MGVNPVTLKCHFDIKFAQTGHKFCRLAERNVWLKLKLNRPKASGDMERTQIEGLST